MEVIELLRKKGSEIVDKATDAIIGSHLRHYENADPAQTRERVKALCDLTLECLVRKSTMPMIKYAEKIAQQRFSSGFSLREVQTAFNVLEESIWDQILKEMQPVEYAERGYNRQHPTENRERVHSSNVLFVCQQEQSTVVGNPGRFSPN